MKEIGLVPSDKVVDLFWSGVGNIFCTIENEALNRKTLNFYLIQKHSNEG